MMREMGREGVGGGGRGSEEKRIGSWDEAGVSRRRNRKRERWRKIKSRVKMRRGGDK